MLIVTIVTVLFVLNAHAIMRSAAVGTLAFGKI